MGVHAGRSVAPNTVTPSSVPGMMRIARSVKVCTPGWSTVRWPIGVLIPGSTASAAWRRARHRSGSLGRCALPCGPHRGCRRRTPRRPNDAGRTLDPDSIAADSVTLYLQVAARRRPPRRRAQRRPRRPRRCRRATSARLGARMTLSLTVEATRHHPHALALSGSLVWTTLARRIRDLNRDGYVDLLYRNQSPATGVSLRVATAIHIASAAHTWVSAQVLKVYTKPSSSTSSRYTVIRWAAVLWISVLAMAIMTAGGDVNGTSNVTCRRISPLSPLPVYSIG